MHDSYLAEYMRKTRPDIFNVRPFTYEKKEETPLVEFKLPELHGKLKEAIDEHYASLNARRYRQDPDIMDAAIYGKFAIDKVKENEMERGCSNCKYHSLRVEFMPCSVCSNHSHWKPKEDEMNNRVKKIQNELMKFAEEKRLGYEFEYDSFTNRLKAKFTEGPFCKKYEIHGDGCNPNVIIADTIRDLTQFFKLKSSTMYGDLPAIKDIIFNDPATIVFWVDGTKTVVKAQDEEYDPEKGMAMAIAKKALGNQGNYCNVFKKWLPEEVEIEFTSIDKIKESINGFKKALDELKFKYYKEEEVPDFRTEEEAKDRRRKLTDVANAKMFEMWVYKKISEPKDSFEYYGFICELVSKYIDDHLLDLDFLGYVEDALLDKYGVKGDE